MYKYVAPLELKPVLPYCYYKYIAPTELCTDPKINANPNANSSKGAIYL